MPASTRILVLGGGAQGRVIAADLARALPGSLIDVADVRDPRLPPASNLRWIEANLGDLESAARLIAAHDLAVGALPSRFGFGVMRVAIEVGRPLVDVSFSSENPLTLDAAARAAGVAILPDCGLAPGLSHLIAGEGAARRGTPDEISILVGGVAEDPARPYGYVVTWSLDDLLEEYVRPARIVRGGEPVTVPVFSGYERIQIDGVGEMESFYSDGLRTLIETLPGVPEMAEKTLRWPGHVEAVRPLLGAGRMVEELRERCTTDPPRDLVVLLVRLRWEGGVEQTMLVDRYDPATGMTAMSRTTALTTSVVAQMVAAGAAPEAGVRPLEVVARNARANEFIRQGLAKRGLRLERREWNGEGD